MADLLKFAFRLRSIQPNSYLGHWRNPFCVRMKLIIRSLPGTCWDEFDSNIFSPLLLHTFQDIIRFLVPKSWCWGWPIQIFAKCSYMKKILISASLFCCCNVRDVNLRKVFKISFQGISPSMGHLGLLFFVNRFPSVRHWYILVCSFSNNLSQHLLLWHGVPYGVGWMVAFIYKLFLKMTIEALNCQINSPMEDNE